MVNLAILSNLKGTRCLQRVDEHLQVGIWLLGGLVSKTSAGANFWCTGQQFHLKAKDPSGSVIHTSPRSEHKHKLRSTSQYIAVAAI